MVHVFPDGEDEFQLAEAGRVPGELAFTEHPGAARRDRYCRKIFGRANAFEEANHSIVFTVSTDEAAAETVAQIVAQVAGDYQLVEDARKATISARTRVAAHARGPRRATDGPVPARRAGLFPPSQRRRSDPKTVDLQRRWAIASNAT